jgi:hypothetical protein
MRLALQASAHQCELPAAAQHVNICAIWQLLLCGALSRLRSMMYMLQAVCCVMKLLTVITHSFLLWQ